MPVRKGYNYTLINSAYLLGYYGVWSMAHYVR